MKVSRRKLAQTLAAAAATATLAGQAPQQPAPPKPEADAELQSARAQLRASAQTVARVPLPMSAEPASRFEPRT